jgi:hypothetical protein
MKSASPQAFFCCAATQTWFFKSAIALIVLYNFRCNFNRNFYDFIWYGEFECIGSYSVVVKASASKSVAPGLNLGKVENCLTILYLMSKDAFAFLAL